MASCQSVDLKWSPLDQLHPKHFSLSNTHLLWLCNAASEIHSRQVYVCSMFEQQRSLKSIETMWEASLFFCVLLKNFLTFKIHALNEVITFKGMVWIFLEWVCMRYCQCRWWSVRFQFGKAGMSLTQKLISLRMWMGAATRCISAT